METSVHPVTPCTSQVDGVSNSSNESIVKAIFKIENITVARPSLLKIFYWESLDIANLNKKLLTQAKYIEHHLDLPTSQLYSKPLKIVLWLRNLSNFEYIMRWKRIQNCQCMPKETRVGFNQFRNLYHCPHRKLINISQEIFVMRPNELLAMSVVSYYHILGAFVLTYELKVADNRIVMLHFHLNITTFDAIRSVLSTNMIPVNIKEHRCMAQPLWIGNITKQKIKFSFTSNDRSFRIINPNIVIPGQSVWPLIVECIPSDFENNLELFLKCGEKASKKHNTKYHHKIPITCKGFLEEEKENYTVPISDYECSNYLYVIYPNRMEFAMEINEERTLMVAVHNYNQKSMEFIWQTYGINKYFSFTFEPTKFYLKPHHSKLCIVRAKSFDNPLHFKRIPAVLEVHRILDKSVQIAKELLKEIESIDDPRWSESSYVEHVLLHLDLKVKFPEIQRRNVKQLCKESIVSPIDEETIQAASNNTTIFEKLFWEYLSKSNYMRDTSKIPKNLTYKQVLSQETTTKKKEHCALMDKQKAFNILSFLTAEACRDLSKNYRFVPPELLDLN